MKNVNCTTGTEQQIYYFFLVFFYILIHINLDRKDFDIYNDYMNSIKYKVALITVFLCIAQAFSYTKNDLLSAVKSDSSSEIKKILTKNSHLATVRYDSDGNSILIIALQKECNEKIIDMILKAGCDPNIKNDFGQTALMTACKKSYGKKVIEKILSYDVMTKSAKEKRILQKDKNGKTAFDYAASNQEAYDTLLKYAKDPAKEVKETNQEQTEQIAQPLSQEEAPKEEKQPAASQTEPAPEAQKTQEQNTPTEQEKTAQKETPAEPQKQAEQLETNQLETEKISSKNAESSDAKQVAKIQPENSETPSDSLKTVTPVTPAVPVVIPQEKQKETEAKLEDKASVTLPQLAVSEPEQKTQKENTDTVLQNETETVEINADIHIPQIDYYNRDKPEYLFDDFDFNLSVAEEPLKENIAVIQNPDTRDNLGRTRLMNAIIANDFSLCKSLLYSGANVNAKDKDGWTPLMYACKYVKTPETVNLLFSYNADIKGISKFGLSVLQIAAAFCQNKDVLSVILAKAEKENINIFDSFITALKEERPVQIISQYLKFITNINSLHNGKTTLMYCAEYYESTDVIKLLLENGADPYIISSEKKNAFGYAKENSKIVHDSIYWSLNVSSSKKR